MVLLEVSNNYTLIANLRNLHDLTTYSQSPRCDFGERISKINFHPFDRNQILIRVCNSVVGERR